MLINIRNLLFIFIFYYYSNVNCIQKWNYKYSQTGVNNNQQQQQLTINCINNEQIWIGWSHYGTRQSLDILVNNKQVEQQNDFLTINTILHENDCWMNFTEKIAEQCNGANECDISSQSTYIHKCGKISDYIFVSYVCYKAENNHDICKESNIIDENLLITSPDFPNEYPGSIDCTCSIISNNFFKFDILWFSLQDNDFLNIRNNKNLSGWLNPTNELIIANKTANIRFKSDDALSYKGFWLKVVSRKACKDDWQLVGDTCIKVFSESLDWRAANQKCQSMNGYLVKIEDVINDLKLTQYMKINYPEIISYWIGLRKYVDVTNKEKWMWSDLNSTLYNDVSWWPWRRLTDNTSGTKQIINQNCIIKRRNEDGYFTVSCEATNRNSFICQTDNSNSNIKTKINMKCGETELVNRKNSLDLLTIEPFKIATTTTVQQQQKNSVKFNLPIELNKFITTLKSSSIKNKELIGIDDIEEFNRNSELLTTILKSKFDDDSNSSSTNKIETKYSSTVLYGIIFGIVLVFLIVNILVIVVCRRNIQKLIKNSRNQSPPSTQSNNDDLTQEYFESFTQTLPSTYNHHHQHVSTIKPILLRKDVDLLQSLTLKSNGNNLFKPITNDLLKPETNNQYDKMNHQINKLLINNRNENDSNQQHFYESVDTLELPHSNRNNLKINNNQNMLFNINSNSSNNSNDFNSTSSSTTSSASSTNQFIRQMSKHQIQHKTPQFNVLTAIQQNKNISNGSWSPDSAYYSSIPNYCYNNSLLQQQQQQQQQIQQMQSQSHQRQPFNFNFLNQNELLLNDNFKSQFV